MGNACGAIVVTRHGCANFMPYEREALAFIDERGGF
jgi:5-dehydro-2-deoxygluconokinase